MLSIEIKEYKYTPKPSYAFYKNYSKNLNIAKKNVHKSLCFDNVALTGFLRVAIEICDEY